VKKILARKKKSPATCPKRCSPGNWRENWWLGEEQENIYANHGSRDFMTRGREKPTSGSWTITRDTVLNFWTPNL
jgi:hypothetical protein